MARVFAIINLVDVVTLLSPAGLVVVGNARHSIDKSQIVLDFNHSRETIDSMFLAGIDTNLVIEGCEILNHQDALILMNTSNWYIEERF